VAVNPKIEALQTWLNAKGWKPQLTVDGVPGPATREAFYGIFANRAAPAVTDVQIDLFAHRLEGPSSSVRAIATVEASGSGFLTTGHPKILWERHKFFDRWRVRIPLISDPVFGGYTLDADKDGINDSWEKLTEAAMLSPAAALESCSWGKFQVMGFWWQKLGYPSVAEFAWSMRESEAAHYEAMVRYIEKSGLKRAFQKLSADPEDCRDFARGYNGKGYEKGGYHLKLADAIRRG
jgi:hypothetical protein